MKVRLTFAGPGDEHDGAEGELFDAALSLSRWLVRDPELRRSAEINTGSAKPQSGHMGGVLDVVDVVLSNAIALSSLIVSVATWRAARPGPVRVRLELGDRAVTVEGTSPEEVEHVLRALNPEDPSDKPERAEVTE